MLHELFIVLLLALEYTSPLKKSTRLSKKPPHFPASCARVKCPREERPACARLRYRQPGAAPGDNQTVHVVMLNECEINYVKCHEGLEATIVPMKNCGHENPLKTRHKRVKRDLASGVWHQAFRQSHKQIVKGPKRQGEEEQAPDVEAPEADVEAPEGVVEAPEEDHGGYLAGGPPSPTSIQEGIEDADYEAHVAEQLQATVEEHDELTDASLQHLEAPAADDGAGAGDGASPHDDWPYSDSASAELLFSFHSKGKKVKNVIEDEEPDMDEYQADCPKVCPARDVMVCARCQHAVYRTFLSVCHMRMFQCDHKDEKLHLATRLPCVMSAPYLAESRMQPRGRVREAGDDDLVLRFIRCSALGDQSREDDPRCYLEKQKLMLQLETYNISDRY